MFWHQELSEPVEEVKAESELSLLSDYFKRLNVDQMINVDIGKFALPKPDPDSILGTQDDINYLIKDTLQRNNRLNDVGKRIEVLSDRIDYMSSFFFDNTAKRRSKIKENRFYIPDSEDSDSLYLTEVENANKSRLSSASEKKTLHNYSYTVFNDAEFTQLPGYLEAPQLLNSLTSKMKQLKPSFLKYWHPIIRSEASCAILLDSFWWFYLRYFRTDLDSNEQSYKYFCRLAENFASLLFSIDNSIKDRFFEYYANFLCQTIYFAFFKSFPDSRLQFNDRFKEVLSNTVYEWILGVRPMKESYLKWEINDETNTVNNKDYRVSSANRIMEKIQNLELMLNELGEEMCDFSDEMPPKEVRFRNDLVPYERSKSLDNVSKKPTTPTKSVDIEKRISEWYSKNGNESHVVGEGDVIEKLGFNPRGQSVLINQYRKMYNLYDSASEAAFKVTRSEITRYPPRTAPTYRDLIFETLQRSKSAGDELKKIMKTSEDEFNRIEVDRKRAKAEHNRIRRSASLSSRSSRKA